MKGISFFEYRKGPKIFFQKTPCEGTVVVGVRNHHCQIYSGTQTHWTATDMYVSTQHYGVSLIAKFD